MAELQTAAEPELCRVSIIGGSTQVDVALPASVPVTAFITDLVALITSHEANLAEPDDGAPLQAQHWTLGRLGHAPIEPFRTLAESGVHDGELLMLRALESPEPPALFDDVIGAVVRLIDDSHRGWSAVAARWIGLMAAVGGAACASVLLGMNRGAVWSVASASVGLGVGALTLVAAYKAMRSYAESLAAAMLSLCGLILVFIGAASLAPGDLGAPHLLLGAAATLLVAVVVNRVIGAGRLMLAAVVTVAVFGGAGAAVVTVWHGAPSKVAAVVVVCALVAITVAPRLAVVAARLPVPPVPTAGAVIDPRDHEPRPTIEGIGAIGATSIPSAADLGMRASLANDYQSGMMLGIAITASASSIIAAQPFGHMRGPAIALAAVVGLVLCLRGRAFADLVQAGALITGGCLTELTLGVGYGVGSHVTLIKAAVALLVFGGAAAVVGVAGPHVDISPSMARLIEITEYLLICAVGPLAYWVVDFYRLARNL